MEQNEFLLYNEAICRIHGCRTRKELQSVLLTRLKLLIPYRYASIITIRKDGETETIFHDEVFCHPQMFEAFERAWLKDVDQACTLWLSHAVDSVVVRGSEDSDHVHLRFRDLHRSYDIIDDLEVNITYQRQVLGRLALYRTPVEGPFTEQDAFYLRALSIHINQAWWECMEGGAKAHPWLTPAEVAQTYGLTRREEEVFGLVLEGLTNEEMAEKLCISKKTLPKHLQNLYRKCGVSSRQELIKSVTK